MNLIVFSSLKTGKMMNGKENCHCVVLGVSHKTCPVSLRDRLGFSEESLEPGLVSLGRLPGLSEAVILSTCNRTEIYAATLYPETLRDTLINWWAEFRRLEPGELIPHCFYLTHTEAVSHLYSVVSSVDSLVLGENQILGQVRGAFLRAEKTGHSGFLLNHLFQEAMKVGKRVRECTAISEGTVSVPFAAVSLCKNELGGLESHEIGVLGLGEMGSIAAVNLAAAGAKLRFFNRTESKAFAFAEKYGGEGFGLKALPAQLPELDALITCAASPKFLVTLPMIQGHPRLAKSVYVDIGVPRNVDPAIANFPGVSLFSIDDLNKVVETNRRERRKSAEEAREIIEDAVEEFAEWFKTLNVIPLMLAIRRHYEEIGDELLRKWENKVPPETFSALKRYNEELLAKILHEPSVQLKKLGAAGLGLESRLIVEKLLDLDMTKEESDDR